MISEKLNSVAERYKTGACGFIEVYTIFQGMYGGRYEKIAGAHRLDVHDVQAGHEDVLMKALDRFDPSKGVFSHFLNTLIRNKMMDLRREQATRNSREILCSTLPGEDTEGNVFYFIKNKDDVENEVMETEINDKRRKLVAGIVGTGNTNVKMKKVYEGIMSGQSLHSAAKHCGVCHKTVKRRFTKMAGFYDRNKYGEIQDYFTV